MASLVPKVASKIKKNCILAKYDEACHAKGMTNQVSTVTKGEISASNKYPPHQCLIINCMMKIGLKHNKKLRTSILIM